MKNQNYKDKGFNSTKVSYAERNKITQQKYVHSFNKFEDGISAITMMNSDIERLFEEAEFVTGVDYKNIEGAITNILNIFISHKPSPITRKNIHYDLSISANRCSLKTDKFLSFGWYIKSIKKENNIFEMEYIFHITIIGNNEDLVKELKDENWILDPYKK